MDFAPRCIDKVGVTNDLSLEHDGAALIDKALAEDECADLEQRLAHLPKDNAGVRIGAAPTFASLLEPAGKLGKFAAHVLGSNARAVRAILFDKTPAQNWSLTWHQDRTIVVEQREEVAGFGPWTLKSGLVQVEPPFDVIERMVTMRIHLDPVDETNAPLRIVPSSHRLGRVPEAEIAGIVEHYGERTCLAGRGDIWLYATAIIHASRAADPPRRRRVLQVDYSSEMLPEPLHWRGL